MAAGLLHCCGGLRHAGATLLLFAGNKNGGAACAGVFGWRRGQAAHAGHFDAPLLRGRAGGQALGCRRGALQAERVVGVARAALVGCAGNV